MVGFVNTVIKLRVPVERSGSRGNIRVCIRKKRVSNLFGVLCFLTENFRAFIESQEANSGIIHQIKP
jgi:hypothetical protein